MGKGSLFGRLADALKEDDGPSNEEIDAEFDKAMADIEKVKVDKVDAAAILDPGYKVAGGMVYVINLTEIYKKIGQFLLYYFMVHYLVNIINKIFHLKNLKKDGVEFYLKLEMML